MSTTIPSEIEVEDISYQHVRLLVRDFDTAYRHTTKKAGLTTTWLSFTNFRDVQLNVFTHSKPSIAVNFKKFIGDIGQFTVEAKLVKEREEGDEDSDESSGSEKLKGKSFKKFAMAVNGFSFESRHISEIHHLGIMWRNKDGAIHYEIDVKRSTPDPNESLRTTFATRLNLEAAFESGRGSDFKFMVDGKAIAASKLILMSQSPYFVAMFDSVWKDSKNCETVEKDIEYETIYELVRAMYSSKLELKDKVSALKLFMASDKYEVDWIRKETEDYIINGMSDDFVLTALKEADARGSLKIKEAALMYIKSYKCDYVSNLPGFENIDKSLCSVIMDFVQKPYKRLRK